MTRISRRLFMQSAAALGVMLALPRRLLAGRPDEAFAAKTLDEALERSFGTTQHTPSDKVTLIAPEIAQDGAVVPISVATTLPGVESISIVVAENPQPLTASFALGDRTVPEVSTRIKIGKSSPVLAVVKADGKLYSAGMDVKVTIGGCGG